MAWTNIFDLGDWDVYIQFAGVSGGPTPDSVGHLVLAADLDPAVGTVTVAEGVITLELEGGSGGGGDQPRIVVMPSGTPPDTAPARVSALWDGSPFAGVSPVSSQSVRVLQASSVTETGGPGEYEGNYSLEDDVPEGIEVYELEYDQPLQSGSGLGFLYVAEGF